MRTQENRKIMLLSVVTTGFLYLSVFTQTSGAIDWGKKLNRKIDCATSPWTDWKCGATECERTRTITRNARNGGKPCAALSQKRSLKGNEGPWSRENVAQKVHIQFVVGNRRVLKLAGKDNKPGDKIIQSRDLMILLDMSGSISKAEFTETKRKMGEMIALICGTIGKTRQHNRIAVITFSKSVRMNFDFKTHFDLESVKKAIMAIPQERSSTCTGDAFHYAHTYMFDPSKGVRDATISVKEVLVLTDGRSNCGRKLATQVQKLQVKAIVFALAIGDFTPRGKKEIESMVSRPLTDHIFSLDSFKSFFEMVDGLKQYLLLTTDRCVPFELSK